MASPLAARAARRLARPTGLSTKRTSAARLRTERFPGTRLRTEGLAAKRFRPAGSSGLPTIGPIAAGLRSEGFRPSGAIAERAAPRRTIAEGLPVAGPVRAVPTRARVTFACPPCARLGSAPATRSRCAPGAATAGPSGLVTDWPVAKGFRTERFAPEGLRTEGLRPTRTIAEGAVATGLRPERLGSARTIAVWPVPAELRPERFRHPWSQIPFLPALACFAGRQLVLVARILVLAAGTPVLAAAVWCAGPAPFPSRRPWRAAVFRARTPGRRRRRLLVAPVGGAPVLTAELSERVR